MKPRAFTLRVSVATPKPRTPVPPTVRHTPARHRRPKHVHRLEYA